ncbi:MULTISPECIES: MIP/aquaporin family protein [Oerskovia]|uniref:Glycerol facilitator-aquaporin gla n=1 Tax=Oerskovia enterophila TaxID=43678 RepID=A0A163Q164_9CELL|nr:MULTISPECIES: MIP/aquaporin family protein [Oerskovia]KRC33022.1 glycerol uptake permease [Oerskovia sp. Root22]KRD35811.1 glycerol uptake permease [Oerskovia sp. Root918]KZM33706.1 glycerol facilitator-aquaporin gla [Oerskovia enterophila]OCI33084.1 glycerol facilitator-aquaporin gla [Oerskovia enterophila]
MDPDYSLAVRAACEFIGTAILIIIGNGTVANVHLKGSKGYGGGWSLIAMGYGFGVMIPALMFGGISGNHINPAFTIGLATWGMFPWADVAPYVVAQMLGAMAGQLAIVATHKPYYDRTENVDDVLATFSTVNAAHSRLNGFANELLGSVILFSCALAIINSPLTTTEPGLAHLALGFLVWGLVAGLGGPTGPALNPARDLGPRIVHALLPLKHKGPSDWGYAWVPVVAPLLAGLIGVGCWKLLLG